MMMMSRNTIDPFKCKWLTGRLSVQTPDHRCYKRFCVFKNSYSHIVSSSCDVYDSSELPATNMPVWPFFAEPSLE